MSVGHVKVQIVLFQFHNGTIKTVIKYAVEIKRNKFQFHDGTIKTSLYIEYHLSDSYFNSIMVQLKHQNHWWVVKWKWFQFHNGTIKTLELHTTLITSIIFQFHNGTIKTGIESTVSNMTKSKFQFHNGTIKTHRHL